MDYSKYSKLINKNREADPQSYDEIREKIIVDKIRNGIEEGGEQITKPRSENEELAVLRKAVKYLYDLISVLHQGEIDNEEFMKYYNDVETAKAHTKIPSNPISEEVPET